MAIYFVELNKDFWGNMSQPLRDWISFLNKTYTERHRLAESNPDIARAYDMLELIQDDLNRRGEAEGKAEGMAEARAAAKEQALEQASQRLQKGWSFEEVAAFVKIPLEELQSLKNT